MSFSYGKESQRYPELSTEANIISNKNKSNISVNQVIPTNPGICLYTRKLNDEEIAKGDIRRIIYNSFNDPADYFLENSPVHVNSKKNLEKIDLFSHKEVKNTKMQQRKENMSLMTGNNESKSSLKRKPTLINNNNGYCKKYEIIDNNGLKKIFENFKMENEKNKHSRNNEVSLSRSINNLNKSKSNNNLNNSEENSNSNINNNVYPYDLCRSLNYQNKQMAYRKKNVKKVMSLSKFISKKINKQEDDLLINKVDLFKYKKEILSGLSQEKPREEKFGKFQWNMDLRRPIDFKGFRQLYVNVNSERNPFWGVIVERCPEEKETAVRPGYNLNQKEFIKFVNNKNIQNNKNKNCVNTIENLDDLKVKGENLLDMEYKREMSTKGRKILHKVFIENGKTVLEQDINNVFGEETLYKHYENKHRYNKTIIDKNKNNNNNNIIITEGENVHYKYNKGKSRINSSISRSLDKTGNNSNIYNNAITEF